MPWAAVGGKCAGVSSILRERLGHGYQNDDSTANAHSRPWRRRPVETPRGCLDKGTPELSSSTPPPLVSTRPRHPNPTTHQLAGPARYSDATPNRIIQAQAIDNPNTANPDPRNRPREECTRHHAPAQYPAPPSANPQAATAIAASPGIPITLAATDTTTGAAKQHPILANATTGDNAAITLSRAEPR